MTRFNKKLAEKPDHGHYPVCLGRKTDIERNSVTVLAYTCAACAVLLTGSLITARFSVISWIPALFGDSTDVGALFVQILVILAIVGLAAVNCSKKYRICGVILFMIYLAMGIFGIIGVGSNSADFLTFAIGALGAVKSAVLIPDYLDWKQLKETEGFPHFNERFAYQNENSNYAPVHTGEGASDKMSSPDQIDIKNFTGLDNMPEMPELPSANQFGDPGVGAVYIPECGKYCAMSESPIKTS